MTKDHLPEWEKIKKWYEEEHEQTPEIKFRIQCIDELLIQEKEKELNHFR
ncbi:MAG TPA: hypothetical protein VLE21_04740 [Candidatus Nitrosocosmicus sp.]|nr:hypothetical protein [Candidatus Nitrosocosmicus sp.]